MPLTVKEIENIKPSAKDVFLSDKNGLYLRVRPSGNKIWLIRYKIQKITKWFEIGQYPLLSLHDARVKTLLAKSKLKEGLNPAEEDKLQKLKKLQEIDIQNQRVNVEKLFNRWFDLDISKHKDKGKEVLRAFHKDVLPVIGKIPAEEITKKHISEITDSILIRGSNRMARQVFSHLRQMFRFALERDIIKVDPTATIKKTRIGKKETPRDRFLTDNEITDLINVLPASGLPPEIQSAILITLATGCRIGELSKAKWEDIDFKKSTWLIPDINSKNGMSLTIFLSDFAKAHFLKIKQTVFISEWCLPGRNINSPINSKTITKMVSDRQLADGKVKIAKRTSKTKALVLSGGKWTPHDLRRTAATQMIKLGISPDVVDRCLNHIEQRKLRRVYMQYKYEEEMQNAWETLGKRLELLTHKEINNLLFLNFRKS